MKRIGKILSVLLLVLTFSNVGAVSVSKAGETVEQKGDFASSRFVAGYRITNKANIDGIMFGAANSINASGKSSYGFYAGNSVTIAEDVEKDLFVAGNMIVIDSDAKINRDAYIAGNSIVIKSDIARDLKVGGSSVDISDVTIGGDAFIAADAIVMNEKTIITGKLTYSEDTKVTGLKSASIGEIKKLEVTQTVEKKSFGLYVRDFIVSSVAAFICLIVLFYLIPKAKERLNDLDLSAGNIFKSLGFGLLTLVVVPVLFIASLFTWILVPLGLIAILIYAICIYLAYLVFYYVVGHLIMSKLFKKDNVYLSMIIGIILVKLIKYIPYIGGLVSFVALLYGLGLIVRFIFKKEK